MRSNSHKGWVVGPGEKPLAVMRIRHPSTHRVQRMKPAEVLQRHQFFPTHTESDDAPSATLTWAIDITARTHASTLAEIESIQADVVDDDFAGTDAPLNEPTADEDPLSEGAAPRKRAHKSAVPSDLFSSGDEDGDSEDGDSEDEDEGEDEDEHIEEEDDEAEAEPSATIDAPVGSTEVPSDLFSSDEGDAIEEDAAEEEEDAAASPNVSDDEDAMEVELAREREAQLGLFAALSRKQPVATAPGGVVSFGKTAPMGWKPRASRGMAAFSSDEEDMTDLSSVRVGGSRALPASAPATDIGAPHTSSAHRASAAAGQSSASTISRAESGDAPDAGAETLSVVGRRSKRPRRTASEASTPRRLC
jgi:hypothetical protein